MWRNKLYLAGGSISGQVNQVMLGKATKTFVKKLKVSQIDDLHAPTDQVKDTIMIVINTSINNLWVKEATNNSVNDLIESVTSFREVATKSETVLSKAVLSVTIKSTLNTISSRLRD